MRLFAHQKGALWLRIQTLLNRANVHTKETALQRGKRLGLIVIRLLILQHTIAAHDENLLSKLEESINSVKFSELENKGVTLGWSSKGYFALSNGTDCFVFDFDKLIKIIDKNLDLSIRKFNMKYYNLTAMAFWIKIKLLNLNRVTINYSRRNTKDPKPQASDAKT